MPPEMSEEEVYRLARKRVEEKKEFYGHLVAYAAVNLLLIIIWAATGAGFPWFVFPLGGWGIAVALHYFNVFVFARGGQWEQREIEKEAGKLRRGPDR